MEKSQNSGWRGREGTFWGYDYVLYLNRNLCCIGVCIYQKLKEYTPKICAVFLYLNFAQKKNVNKY